MKKLSAILIILSNYIYSQNNSDLESLLLNKINEPSLAELHKKTIFEKINDSLVWKTEKDSITYKTKNYRAWDFELFELKYQSAFGAITLYRVYGDGLNYKLIKKTLTEPTYGKEDKIFKKKIQKSDSIFLAVNKETVDKYKSEIEKYNFWSIREYKSALTCLDGTTVKVSGLIGNP